MVSDDGDDNDEDDDENDDPSTSSKTATCEPPAKKSLLNYQSVISHFSFDFHSFMRIHLHLR